MDSHFNKSPGMILVVNVSWKWKYIFYFLLIGKIFIIEIWSQEPKLLSWCKCNDLPPFYAI